MNRRLEKAEAKCLDAFKKIGVVPGEYIIVVEQTEDDANGYCYAPKKTGDLHKIVIHPRFLDEKVNEVFLIGILAHEMLHTCCGDYTHNRQFRERAEQLYKMGIPANLGLGTRSLQDPDNSLLITCNCGAHSLVSPHNDDNTYLIRCGICGMEKHMRRNKIYIPGHENWRFQTSKFADYLKNISN